jgi:dipeptidyl aminopeptidase/acylaminoacyl peptidase
MRLNQLLTLTGLLLSSLLIAQKPAIQLEDIDNWNTIQQPQISNDGHWTTYQIQPNDGDPLLVVHDNKKDKDYQFARGKEAMMSADNQHIAFLVSPFQDTLKEMRRRKVEDKELPKDTLYIVNLRTEETRRIPNVNNFSISQKWEGWMAYHLAPAKRDSTLPDSIKVKKQSEDNGSLFVVHNLRTGQEDTISYVKSYVSAEEGPRFLVASTGDDSTFLAGTYLYDCPTRQLVPLLTGDGEYEQLTFNESGTKVAFMAYQDTIQPQSVPFTLYYWQDGMDVPSVIADSSAAFLPDHWLISQHQKLSFSEDDTKLYFGINPPPILKDTTLLEEEIVDVEVWNYQDPRLYTHEEVRLEEAKKKAYTVVYHLDTEKIIVLGNEEIPNISLGDEGNAPFALGYNDQPYLQQISWEGFPYCKDVYLIDVNSGEATLIKKKVCGDAQLSPKGKFVYWYSHPDSAWYTYSIRSKKLTHLASDLDIPFYDELNDQPMHPYPYGVAGWTTDDDFIMVYDRYDVWLIDPEKTLYHNNLTNGRAQKKQYRYIKLDPEERSIEEVEPMLFYTFDEDNKYGGYAWFNIHTGVKDQVQEGPYQFRRGVLKARDANQFVSSREDFSTFPDLHISGDNLKTLKKISDANPQQKDFRWGTAELYTWTGADGQEMEGIVIKPEGFDPNKQYPAMTYFYERYANSLHRHWTPRYPRSIINFPYYASRGYVIFIPDIHYRVGYPGESALDAITSGVTSLIDEGYIDKSRIGVQGHSWGGYQVAYLITQTDLFKCAESGAPVVNMTSAYGGIRWTSGLSRMFQYEHTQSRLGGTLWEKPLRYIENSPLFFADKINTPVLILHNDEDGAVPWYQGIEFFVALRRLGKPSWLLNYNGDPHGVKEPQNRRDFQQRMQQFFDYYLLDAPKPSWMERGVPPMEKGIMQGFEAIKE